MKKKILFVSIAFPPKNDPEALQVARYFHYLQKHNDLQIDVVTSALPTLNMPYDSDLEPYAVGVNQLINISLKENRYFNFIRNRLRLQETVFPDAKQSFYKQYRKVLHQLKETPDLIYSRADPKSSTLMAYELKMKLNVPWILHMSDPWADCPTENMSVPYYKKSDEWERKCIGTADIVSLTSVPTVNFYRKKYPELAEKFRFYPNVYESNRKGHEDEVSADFENRKLRFVFTGSMVGERGAVYFLKPLKELYEADASIADQLEVILAGEADHRNQVVLQNYKLPFVKWIGRIPFNEAIRLQRWADCLIAIDFPVEDPEMAMFFLSKLLDYMVAKKRILTLTTKGSAADQVMQDLKGDVCGHNDTQGIKEVIVKALDAFKKGEHSYFVNESVPEKYEASYNADRLYAEMISLINANNKIPARETHSSQLR